MCPETAAHCSVFFKFFYQILRKQGSAFVGCYFQRQISSLLGPADEIIHCGF